MSPDKTPDEQPQGDEQAQGEAPAEAKAPAKRARKPAKAKAAQPKAEKAGKADGDDAETAEREQAAGAKAAAKKPAAKKATPAAAKKPAGEKTSEQEAKPVSAPRAAAKAAAKAPRRRVVQAHARYVRTSARKARMVCGHLRGKSVQEARAILAFTSRDVARDWSKLLESAVANAESNHELLEDDLIVREAYADEGPTIKRFRPRAMGRATPINKRTSHLTIALSPRPERGTTDRHG
jgi:ribosomal protein L22